MTQLITLDQKEKAVVASCEKIDPPEGHRYDLQQLIDKKNRLCEMWDDLERIQKTLKPNTTLHFHYEGVLKHLDGTIAFLENEIERD